MITYRHERFIAQALESVLMQKVDFPFEIVIGEDKSPDGTLRVVEKYQRQHADKIRLIARERNLGSGNFVATYAACRGRYVAILEGDDYWTSPEKLQMQVHALDTREDWVLCFHGAQVLYDDGREPQYMFPPERREIFTLDDLLHSNFIPTCSVMFRNGLVVDFPPWYPSLAMGDWPFYILLARHGQLGYLDRVMGTYRVHSGGIWTSKNPWVRFEKSLEMLSQIRQILDRDQCERLTTQIVSGYVKLVAEQIQRGQMSAARSALWGLLRRESLLRPGFPYRDVLRAALEIDAPNVLGMMRWIRRWMR